MKLSKKNIIFLGLGIALMNCNGVSALTKEEINNYIFDVYSERYVGSDRMKEFLKGKGVNISEYEKYLVELDTYRGSNEYLWERIENGSILMDEILFSDKDVRAEYEKALSRLDSQEMAYNFVKKNMMNDSSKFISKFESGIKNIDKVREAYKDKYDRVLTDQESLWLEKIDTMKYALYAGVNGGVLRPEEEMTIDMLHELINEGKGYTVLGLKEQDIKKYMEFVKKREKYDELLISYFKSYSMYQSIYIEIMAKYDVDIYEVLTDKERLGIYEKSTQGFIFNEKTANKKVLNLLIDKKILSKEDIEKGENEDDNKKENDSENNNPWSELEKYLKDKSNKKKGQLLSSLYNTSGINTVFENLGSSFIHIKYKDKDINTQLRLDMQNKLTGAMVGMLFEQIEEEFGVKLIFSKNEVMSLFENKINTFELVIDEEKGIEFNKVAKMFKEIGITLYLKDIDFSESISDGETEGNDNSVEGNKMILNFENKMIEFELGSEEEVERKHVLEILEVLDVKSIISIDSIMVLKNNEIKLSKTLGLKDESISINKLKSLLDDIDEKVNIQVIK